MIPFALLRPTGLWLLFIWLGSAIVASHISDRKGYGELPGLATGVCLSALGVLVWLLVPRRGDGGLKLPGLRRRRS